MSFPVTLTLDDMNAFDTLDRLPLRQMVRASQATSTGLSGWQRIESLSRPNRFRILRHGRGAEILARNGLALVEAQLVLRHAYGSCLDFAEPGVHRVLDHASGTLLEPIMFLRIDAPRRYRPVLLRMLAQRATQPDETASPGPQIVVRTEAPLTSLIGLEQEVLDCTDRAAQILCRLARYGPASNAAVKEASS